MASLPATTEQADDTAWLPDLPDSAVLLVLEALQSVKDVARACGLGKAWRAVGNGGLVVVWGGWGWECFECVSVCV